MKTFEQFKIENQEIIFGGKIYGTTATIYDEYYTDVYDSESGALLFEPAFQ